LPFTKSHAGAAAVLIDEFDARATEHCLDYLQRFLVTGIPPYLDIRDCIPVKPARLRKLPDSPI
jgi:hypothetical protein